ncbi:M20 family metallopeptidase [bacterium]|nr:M20 family metallopeptidase [bacterium]
MPIVNRIAAFDADMKKWRRNIHQNPELGLDCYETASFIEARLREFGIDEIHTGIAKSGIVAIINGKVDGDTIGLRADIDALPMTETTKLEYASDNEGLMHACGHDGHTTMLLGAARYLSETRNFSGRVALIFQPAEENEGGGRIMVEEGILDRFNIKNVYAIHNTPDVALGKFYTMPGPIMAGADKFHIDIVGVGGHGAYPHETKDPITAAVGIAQTFQTIVSRSRDPNDKLVVSVTQIHAGSTDNVTPENAYINGTVRTFDKRVQDMVIKRMEEIVFGHSQIFGLECKLRYEKGYPPTINSPENVKIAALAAQDISGFDMVDDNAGQEMGAEDFSYLLEKRPGAYLFLGIGAAAGLHNTNYDFNDDASVYGASFFARLVEISQPLGR